MTTNNEAAERLRKGIRNLEPECGGCEILFDDVTTNEAAERLHDRVRRDFLDELILTGIVQTPMSYDEIRAVTDRLESRWALAHERSAGAAPTDYRQTLDDFAALALHAPHADVIRRAGQILDMLEAEVYNPDGTQAVPSSAEAAPSVDGSWSALEVIENAYSHEVIENAYSYSTDADSMIRVLWQYGYEIRPIRRAPRTGGEPEASDG